MKFDTGPGKKVHCLTFQLKHCDLTKRSIINLAKISTKNSRSFSLHNETLSKNEGIKCLYLISALLQNTLQKRNSEDEISGRFILDWF